LENFRVRPPYFHQSKWFEALVDDLFFVWHILCRLQRLIAFWQRAKNGSLFSVKCGEERQHYLPEKLKRH